jgi:hypothetical protein
MVSAEDEDAQMRGDARSPSSSKVASAVRIVTVMAAMLFGSSSRLLACPVCFGGAEGSLIDGAKLGVLALVAVTLAVQGAFVAFFLYLRKRAKQVAELDLEAEWSDLQRGTRSS